MLTKPSWILFLLTIKIFKDDVNLWRTWPSHTKLLYKFGSMSESQQEPEIGDIIGAKRYWQGTPHIRIQDIFAGFWIPHHGFRIPGTGFQSLSVELGFWIPIAGGIPDSLSCIPDSRAQDFGFHKQKFPRFRNSDSLTLGDGVAASASLFPTFQQFCYI